MISAGFIGGGAGAEATAEVKGALSNASQSASDQFLGRLGNAIDPNWYNNPAIMSIYGNTASQLIQFGFATWAQSIMWNAQKSIMNRQALMAENISSDRRATEEKMIDFMDSASRRTDGPGGTRERIARIEANRDIEMYERRAKTQERIAAMRSLDSAFGLRSEYSYGSPYAYS